MASINSAALPLAGPSMPVPSTASTTSVAVRISSVIFGHTGQPTGLEHPIILERIAVHLVRIAPSTTRNHCGCTRVKSCRATTKPSPPLLPLPHTTTMRCFASGAYSRSRNSTTRCPAFSIRMMFGMPSSAVRRSTSRICAAVKTFTRAPRPAPAPASSGSRPLPSRSENRRPESPPPPAD